MFLLDKAPRLSISIVIWILSSDTICQLNQFNTNSEAAMLSSFYSLLTSRILCVSLSKVIFLWILGIPEVHKTWVQAIIAILDPNWTIWEPLCPLQTLTDIFGPSYTNLGLCRIKWTPIWIVLETCLAIWDHNDLLFDTLRDYFGTHCTIYGDPTGSYLTKF